MSTLPPLTADEREQRLRELFEQFASFGTPRANASGPNFQQETVMDSARFLKFFRDQNLLDTNLTPTSLDLHFTKAKASFKRTDRKLPWNAFLYALQLAATTKYGSAMSDADALEQLINEAVKSQGPIARATVPVADGVYGKLTDASQYTGQHKDKPSGQSEGKGYTIESPLAKSRATGSRSNSTSNLLDASTGTRGSTGALNKSTSSPRGSKSNLYAPTTSSNAKIAGSKGSLAGRTKGAAGTGSHTTLGSSEYVPTQPSIPKGSVYDRLTNPKGYTATHKERFDDQGKGKGKAGRVQDDLGTKSLEHLVARK
ncbi:hypothetical protein BCR44DRAFT_47259 [Catenaria anguillulae PL171]|uniref:Uncharacterized protein n=1 Tax=Catenaria anguillulae PL171 TaxID=765915 RepID=A0A1Y2HN20_9FUNG|nr:hypothetical protein BCR44DRAFT_47259 [Catenaria anguillulae PL171]